MSNTIIPASTDYFVSVFPDGEYIANRIIAFNIDENGTSAITTGGGVEDCDKFYFKGFVNGIVDSNGSVASGGDVFASLPLFIDHVKHHFNPERPLNKSTGRSGRSTSPKRTDPSAMH